MKSQPVVYSLWCVVLGLLATFCAPSASAQSGSIAGTVTGPGAVPLPDIEVVLYQQLDGSSEWTLQSFLNTPGDGTYSFADLEDGTYTLLFRDWSQEFAFMYYDGMTRLQDATEIVLTGTAETVDVELQTAGRITGTLTDPAGRPLDAPLIFSYTAEAEPELLFIAVMDHETGAYDLGGLPSGEYLIRFTGRQGNDSFGSYYDGAEFVEDALPIQVTAGSTTSGIDGELGLPPGGVIFGRVTDPYGNDFDVARVEALSWDGSQWVSVGSAESYAFEPGFRLPLAPGDVRLRFEGESYLQPGVPVVEYFDNVLSIDDGSDVTIAVGDVFENFDVVVGDLSTGSLSGTVTDASSGLPLAGIEVYAADRRGRVLWDQVAVTDGSGAYTIDGLWPEGYTVEFYDPNFLYESLRLPDAVLVGNGAMSGVDGALVAATAPLQGAVTGTVTGSEDGAPLGNIRVVAESMDGQTFISVQTDSQGHYRLRNLPAGSYQVRFSSREGFRIAEWYDDAATMGGAALVTVTDAVTTASIDAALDPAGVITGSITDRFGNDFFISTVSAFVMQSGAWVQVADTGMAFEEDYRLEEVPVGSVRLVFTGRRTAGDALVEVYDDVATLDEGTDVAVLSGEITPNINAVLGSPPSGTIAGTVTDGLGNALGGISVQVYDDVFELAGEALTGVDGTYEIEELYNGRFYVAFEDPSGVLPSEAYDDVASLQLGTPVWVIDGGTTGGIDAALDGSGGGPGGGGMRGTVTDAQSGLPLAGIRVQCLDEFFSFVDACSTTTAADGSYELAGFLPSGDYFVSFRSPDGFYADEWYDDVLRLDQATAITVSLGAWTDGIDAALEPAGGIRGVVTNGVGNDFPLLTVTAFSFDGSAWQPYKSFVTAYDTDYEILGLPVGDYRLRFRGGSIFNPDSGIIEFYDDVDTVQEGTDIAVAAGQVVDGIDAVLEFRGDGSIAGTVTDAGGQGVAGIEVRIYDDNFDLDGSTVTAADGSYLAPDLFNGRYYVEFEDPSGTLPSEVYDDVGSLMLGTPVDISGGAAVSGIDAVLDGVGDGPGGGGIRGVVTSAGDGTPVAGITVRCLDEFFGSVANCSTQTAADGSYSLAGFLPSGDYFVSFRSFDGFWAEEWYDDASQLAAATPVTVTAGAWSDGINAAVEPAGGVSGSVSNENGSPFQLLTVTAFAWDGTSWEPFKAAISAFSTEYELLGLPAGTYRLRFRGGSITNPGSGIVEFYDDVATVDDGTDVIVNVGQVTPNIDAVLGNINGTAAGLVDPNFDQGLEAWEIRMPSGSSLLYSEVDVAGSADSGSAEIRHRSGAGESVEIAQCIAVVPEQRYLFGGWSQVVDGGSDAPASYVQVDFHVDGGCGDGSLVSVGSSAVPGSHAWQRHVAEVVAPAGAGAAKVRFIVDAGSSLSFDAHWDGLFFEERTVLFSDGFESGTFGGWSTVVGAP